MKKSSIAIATAVTIISILGILYISKSHVFDNMKNQNSGVAGSAGISGQNAGDTTVFGEFTQSVSDGEKVTVRYMKSGETAKIYSISPVEKKDEYYISQSGGLALYTSKDGHIWAFYNDGTEKKITPDTYGSISKDKITKDRPGYIWASQPELTRENRVRFISNLPDISDSPKKSIWEINIEDGNMNKVYTPSSESFRILGYRDDGKLLVLDGDNIAAIDEANYQVENMDIKGKHILSASPDGAWIIFAKKIGEAADLSGLYVMDSMGKKSMVLPKVAGYSAMDSGAWSPDSSRYAFLAKPFSPGDLKVAVVRFEFEENYMEISSYDPGPDTKLPENSKLEWASGSSISVDIGSDVVSIELQ